MTMANRKPQDELMAEYESLNSQMPKTQPLDSGFVGDEPPELTDTDEQLLSQAWQEVASETSENE